VREVPSVPVIRVLFFLVALASLLAAQQPGEPRFSDLLVKFEYDPAAAFNVHENAVETRDGVRIHDLSYASPRGGMVPAYLVVPPGKGPFAAILFGHWMMPGSPLRNRREFLDEAVALAHAGALGLLIDAPMVRPGYVEGKDPLGPTSANDAVHQGVDFRRGIDLLLSRGDVDPRRIAYVGHSFDAKVGALLAGVEKRISSFVLMAGQYDNRYYAFHAGTPEMEQLRKQYGEAKLRAHLADYPWDDAGYYVTHTAPSAVFLQYGRKDALIPESIAHHDSALFTGPKKVAFYNAGHELDAAARKERVEWLVDRLKLKPVDAHALARIPQLH
jgi:hypothetical protein